MQCSAASICLETGEGLLQPAVIARVSTILPTPAPSPQ